jgi:hypothetical protein
MIRKSPKQLTEATPSLTSFSRSIRHLTQMVKCDIIQVKYIELNIICFLEERGVETTQTAGAFLADVDGGTAVHRRGYA